MVGSLSLSYTHPLVGYKAFSVADLAELVLTHGQVRTRSSGLALLREARGVWESRTAEPFYDLLVRPSSGGVYLSFGDEGRAASWEAGPFEEVKLTSRDILGDGELVATHAQGAGTWDRYPDGRGFEWVSFRQQDR